MYLFMWACDIHSHGTGTLHLITVTIAVDVAYWRTLATLPNIQTHLEVSCGKILMLSSHLTLSLVSDGIFIVIPALEVAKQKEFTRRLDDLSLRYDRHNPFAGVKSKDQLAELTRLHVSH